MKQNLQPLISIIMGPTCYQTQSTDLFPLSLIPCSAPSPAAQRFIRTTFISHLSTVATPLLMKTVLCFVNKPVMLCMEALANSAFKNKITLLKVREFHTIVT